MKSINKSEQKLTKKQKRAARLLAIGFKPQLVIKKLKITRTTLWKWRKIIRFEKLCKKYWTEIDSYIETKQKQAISRAWETAVQLMKYPNWKAKAQGAQLILNMHKQAGVMLHKHEGAIGLEASGEIKLKTKGMKKQDKNNIKDLLAATRDLVTPN